MARRPFRSAALTLLLALAPLAAHAQEDLPFPALRYGAPLHTLEGEPRLRYLDQGSGPRTLLLIHGLASNAGFWRENLPELSRHHRVVAVDLPGYGQSQKSPGYAYDMRFFADAVDRLIQELRLEDVVVVGHSMGGQVAMTLALEHPDRVDALVLLAPAGVESFSETEGAMLRAALTPEGIRAADEATVRRNVAANFHAWSDRWEWLVRDRLEMAREPEFAEFAHAVVRSVAGMLDQPTSARLGEIRTPTLVVYGERDALIPNPYLHPGPPTELFRRAAAIPGATLVEIPAAGHLLMIEKPAEVNRAILEFTRG